ncbi:MAG TPA: hypothetical protein DCL07_01550 [Cryomorphaceae bacterium]|jgi:hypothetical protein|nr:MAG: hypothetical protein ABR98_00305 [Cryomorphaceae bacterium BACL7 MAG-120910-bin2]KRO68123.1 MAG: hypothetical protein ABR88_01345 [Cryomorphaceae bacterium BACL7 MAG-120322-bin74]KRO82252.1 MAG: hypothetical protein ABR87_02835 [Cryomorphaceae bacterium BACL7 MAG-121220-bin83]NQW26142.1 hypothetical protein [Cryomorphaceae bacterium]HAB31339.1 hypothetical protein [Cryomorphaceae bacterium]
MSPGPRRNQLEAWMGAIIAGGTPWFIWAYLHATYPALPPVEKIDPDLWGYLLNRVLIFSILIEFSYVIIGVMLRRYELVKMILIISALYAAVGLYYRWEWL